MPLFISLKEDFIAEKTVDKTFSIVQSVDRKNYSVVCKRPVKFFFLFLNLRTVCMIMEFLEINTHGKCVSFYDLILRYNLANIVLITHYAQNTSQEILSIFMCMESDQVLSLIHISEPTRPY